MWVLGGFWKPFPDENWATLLSTCSTNDKKTTNKMSQKCLKGTFEHLNKISIVQGNIKH